MTVADIKTDLLSAYGSLPYRVVAILLPVLLVAVHIFVLVVTLPRSDLFTMTGLMVAYLLPPAGKETVIPIGSAFGIPWWYMALSIAMLDIETGLFMALNFDLAYRIPWFGHQLSNLTRMTGEFILSHRWFTGLRFFAIVIMVMAPFFGSGGIRGSIAGKMLGMETLPVFLAIATGALTGCFLMALGSDLALSFLCVNGKLPALIEPWVCTQ